MQLIASAGGRSCPSSTGCSTRTRRSAGYLRAAGAKPDDRVAEAIAILEEKRDASGRWPHEGKDHFAMDEGEGKPSRWNTLRALRVHRRGPPEADDPTGGANRAEDGTRTRDPNLGKVVLYQLSHFRVSS